MRIGFTNLVLVALQELAFGGQALEEILGVAFGRVLKRGDAAVEFGASGDLGEGEIGRASVAYAVLRGPVTGIIFVARTWRTASAKMAP